MEGAVEEGPVKRGAERGESRSWSWSWNWNWNWNLELELELECWECDGFSGIEMAARRSKKKQQTTSSRATSYRQ